VFEVFPCPTCRSLYQDYVPVQDPDGIWYHDVRCTVCSLRGPMWTRRLRCWLKDRPPYRIRNGTVMFMVIVAGAIMYLIGYFIR